MATERSIKHQIKVYWGASQGEKKNTSGSLLLHLEKQVARQMLYLPKLPFVYRMSS